MLGGSDYTWLDPVRVRRRSRFLRCGQHEWRFFPALLIRARRPWRPMSSIVHRPPNTWTTFTSGSTAIPVPTSRTFQTAFAQQISDTKDGHGSTSAWVGNAPPSQGSCHPRDQHRYSTERPRHRVRLGFDKVNAGSQLESGSVECGAARRLDGEGTDLRLCEGLGDP